jgi:hypothetical protein
LSRYYIQIVMNIGSCFKKQTLEGCRDTERNGKKQTNVHVKEGKNKLKQ